MQAGDFRDEFMIWSSALSAKDFVVIINEAVTPVGLPVTVWLTDTKI